MIKTFVGIDPGATGAIAVLWSDGSYEVWDNDAHPNIQADRFREVLTRVGPAEKARAALEKVTAGRKDKQTHGATSMFKFGYAAGGVAHLLAFAGIPVELVTPAKWKPAVCGSGKGDPKALSLDTARRLFPDAELDLKKHHGRADALLIAEWLRRRENGNGKN